VRLYAEDVAAGFLPSTGRLLHVRWPEGIRVDAGYAEGDEVTRHYDPLLAKLIAHGPHRKLALAKLEEALARTEVLGVRTNLPFLRGLAAHPDVQRGRIDTELVAREFERLVPNTAAAPPLALALAGCAVADSAKQSDDPWSERGAFRIGEAPGTTIVLHEGAREHVVRVSGTRAYEVSGHRIARDVSEAHAWTIDGEPAAAAVTDGSVWVTVAGRTDEFATEPPDRSVDALAASEVTAPMPGVVIGAHARADGRVRRGDLLFVVEAMKMELRVEAPADGTVKRVLASVGQQVQRGQRLAEFEVEG
jgi:3-methylcrotonyl-CoA carboxylase alpha subunit